MYVYSSTYPIRYIEGWNTADYKQIVSVQLPEYYTGVHTHLSNAGDYFLADVGFGLVKLSLSGDSLTQFHGQWAIPSEYEFVKNDKEVSVSYNAMMDLYGMMKSALALQVDQEERAALGLLDPGPARAIVPEQPAAQAFLGSQFAVNAD